MLASQLVSDVWSRSTGWGETKKAAAFKCNGPLLKSISSLLLHQQSFEPLYAFLKSLLFKPIDSRVQWDDLA